MTLSVIVISYNSGRLEACLEALAAQPEAGEIVVADCSDVDPTPALAPRFPRVQFMHVGEKRSVPQLRWAAYGRTTGSIVGSFEARSVPALDWCARMVRAHQDHPSAPAVGGPIALRTPASPRDLGLYLCEYGPFAPPVRTGPVEDVSGANVAYKRAALDRAADLMAAGRWETLLHLRWRREGLPLVLCDATVVFENAMSTATALKQRFAYGRGYAATRLAHERRLVRVAYGAGALVLPLLLTVRLGRSLLGKGRVKAFGRALLWILLFNAAWAAGELAGYLAGDSGHVDIY